MVRYKMALAFPAAYLIHGTNRPRYRHEGTHGCMRLYPRTSNAYGMFPIGTQARS